MPNLLKAAQKIAQTLHQAGHTCYFTGGCVRDSLLNKSPKDFDIATSATPKQVRKLFPKSDSIGAHFGVILVRVHGLAFEVATFRTDGTYTDNRRPNSVTFSSPQEDASRRDFTVNGLFQEPLTGEIIDFVNGSADIDQKIIRAIGNPVDRFQEDALRLMRAIRFATKLDFEIEPATWEAICENAHLLEHIAIERIQAEFNQILVHKDRARGLDLMVQSGLIRHCIPEVLDLQGCEQPPQFHPEGDVYVHTKIMLNMLSGEPSLELCLAVLLHDIGKPSTYSYNPEEDRIRFSGHDQVGAEMAEVILKRLKYSNKTIEEVCAMVKNHMNFMNVRFMKTSKVKRFMARPTYQQEMELHRVDCGSSNGITENYDFLRAKEQEFAAEPLIPPPLISGKDLISLGYPPGPDFKPIIEAIQNEQLEGKLSTKEQAIAWLSENY
ncbi:CCA tRNA nucleotidyltransferase [Rubritalea profundi]|uniref:Phosphohydrolase n=1 Tax=Rubritalea profundi TaxID=1658618 RepID=A0A2S7TZX0_9BACT|nr:CCA tRNA nucleotidyltransferase [Rubritalea profundi]PQJ27503.1 phosphohydrolase [Rubritalea profundi]